MHKTRQPTWKPGIGQLTGTDRAQLKSQALKHGVRLQPFHIGILEALAITTADSALIEIQTRHWWKNSE